jgi:hypothetical protein
MGRLAPPGPNTRSHPYRGLSLQEVDFPLTSPAIVDYLDGREVYRRTDFLALRHRDETALVMVAKASRDPLFSPVTDALLLAGPDEVAFVEDDGVDVGNASARTGTSTATSRPGWTCARGPGWPRTPCSRPAPSAR